MPRLRKFITIVTLLAVATNSAAAELRPRCCFESDLQAKPTCCAETSEQPAEAKPAACCHEKQVGAAHIQNRVASAGCMPLAVDVPPCCCMKSRPATPAVRESIAARVRPDVERAWLRDLAAHADFPSAQDRIRDCRPGRLVPATPPVSVLYCVWLK